MPGHEVGRNATELRAPVICKTDTTDGEGNMVIQCDKLLTRLNGRLYRNARDYKVKFDLSVSPNHDGGSHVSMEFFTLPNTYFVHGAVKYAFERYMQLHQDELDAGVEFARWHDFVINEQNPTGVWEYAGVALWDGTADAGWGELGVDEAISDSSVTDASGTSQGFHLLGNLANSYNIFREYAKKLNYRPQPGATSSDQPYDGLLDLDDADDMAEKGDLRPYDGDWSSFIPDDTTVDDDAGQNLLVHRGSISFKSNGAQGRLGTGFFTAPLGLVWVRKYVGGSEAAFGTTTPELIMTAAPGDYKGVYSRSLTE
jgi:hypothetical protein